MIRSRALMGWGGGLMVNLMKCKLCYMQISLHVGGVGGRSCGQLDDYESISLHVGGVGSGSKVADRPVANCHCWGACRLCKTGLNQGADEGRASEDGCLEHCCYNDPIYCSTTCFFFSIFCYRSSQIPARRCDTRAEWIDRMIFQAYLAPSRVLCMYSGHPPNTRTGLTQGWFLGIGTFSTLRQYYFARKCLCSGRLTRLAAMKNWGT